MCCCFENRKLFPKQVIKQAPTLWILVLGHVSFYILGFKDMQFTPFNTWDVLFLHHFDLHKVYIKTHWAWTHINEIYMHDLISYVWNLWPGPAGIRPFWPDQVRWPESGRSGQIRPDGRNPADLTGFRSDWSPESGWPDSGEGGRIPSPDSGDINRMLSDSVTGNISMVVGYLNLKVDCAV